MIESIYKDKRGNWRDANENLIWCNPGSITFKKEEIVWLLPILYDLGNGWYVPEPKGGYADLSITQRRIRAVSNAHFTRIVELSAEINWRLERVFREREGFFDRELLEKHYCKGDTIESLARIARMSEEEVESRIRRTLNYISGWRRRTRSYQNYCSHPCSKLN